MEALIDNRDFDGLKELVDKSKSENKDLDILYFRIESQVRQRGLKVAVSPESMIEDLARRHFTFVKKAVAEGYCNKQNPVLFIQDLIETNQLRTAELLFTILEEHVKYFKQDNMFETSKMIMIRVCNDLLRRLSRTVDAPFCGRILFFLSRYLPLTEKSGLNANGTFNINNTTAYDEVAAEGESLMAVDSELESGELDDETKEIEVTHDFYKVFWSFQQFLSNPSLVFEKEKYPLFKKNLISILSLMMKNKLDRSKAETDEKIANPEVFFSKYLTSQKLLPLQLNDPRFRQYILLQILIIMQYLKTDMKGKSRNSKLILTQEQRTFVENEEEKCWKLLQDTHPNKFLFLTRIRSILNREVSWMTWKSTNCPDVSEKADKKHMTPFIRRPKPGYDPNVMNLGNAELTKLWSGQSLLESCADRKRKFKPDLEEFIEDPLDENDPEQQVEEEYKSVNDPGFCWRASRYFLASTSHFLPKKDGTSAASLKNHLVSTIFETAKTMDKFKEACLAREAVEAKKKADEELLKIKQEAEQSTPISPNPDADLNDELLSELSKKLASELEIMKQVLKIDSKQKKGDSDENFCLHLLKKWCSAHSYSVKSFKTLMLSHPELLIKVTPILKKSQSGSNA